MTWVSATGGLFPPYSGETFSKGKYIRMVASHYRETSPGGSRTARNPSGSFLEAVLVMRAVSVIINHQDMSELSPFLRGAPGTRGLPWGCFIPLWPTHEAAGLRN